MKTLVIVESPAKAEKIQGYLGKDYIVLASKGHITDLAKGGRFGLGVDIDKDFRPHYILQEDKVDTLDMLLKATMKCDNILIASDPDREGTAPNCSDQIAYADALRQEPAVSFQGTFDIRTLLPNTFPDPQCSSRGYSLSSMLPGGPAPACGLECLELFDVVFPPQRRLL